MPPRGFRTQAPTFGQASKAGSKDPANWFRGEPAYDPTVQADQTQFYNLRNAEYGNHIPLGQALADASQSFANQLRILCDYTAFPFIADLTKAGSLLIPRNPNRSNFYVINLSGSLIYVSFGGVNPDLPGFPIAANAFFNETNGVTGINDIYISSGGATIVGAKILGYEGIPMLGHP